MLWADVLNTSTFFWISSTCTVVRLGLFVNKYGIKTKNDMRARFAIHTGELGGVSEVFFAHQLRNS